MNKLESLKLFQDIQLVSDKYKDWQLKDDKKDVEDNIKLKSLLKFYNDKLDDIKSRAHFVSKQTKDELKNKDSKEIGCVLSEKYWGQGLMPEALKEVISYGFNEERLKCIICSHFLNNNRSKRIIEKCGFNYVKVSNEKAYYCLNKHTV